MNVLAKLTWTELKLFIREPFAVIFTFAFPFIVLVVISGSFSGEDPVFEGATPADYYLPSYIGVVIGAVGLVTLPAHVAGYAERGVLRRFRASSIPVWSILGSQLIAGLVTTAIASVLLVVAGRLIYGAGLPEMPLGVLAGFLVGTASFLMLGLLIAAIAPRARAAQSVGMLLFFPMWLLSGAGPPPSVMSDGMQAVSDVLPLTFVVRALQDPWLGEGQDGTSLVLLSVMLVVVTIATSWMAGKKS